MKPIVLTPGEPAGIGPELCVRIAQRTFPVPIIAVADPALLRARARLLDLPLKVEVFRKDMEVMASHRAGSLLVAPVPCPKTPVCGHPDAANVPYVLETLRYAARGCLNGVFAALVTAPVHKGVISEAGIKFTGHTEFLAALSETSGVVMMLVTKGLRVALATTHLPLREVSDAITEAHLEKVLRTVHDNLQKFFAIDHPRLLVCGLNPHAGEGGHLGHEDGEIIGPVLEKMRATGLRLYGPVPADTAFIPKYLQSADAVVAMYHDQGLPVLKHMGFGAAVNITLGLPFIRTSVDHGTALDLAGTGEADAASLEAAIWTALDMAAAAQGKRSRGQAPGGR